MLLELSLRPVIAFLLLAAVGTGGCDRQSNPQGQASAGSANDSSAIAAPANAAAGNETVVHETIGTLDRSHKGEAAPGAPFTALDGTRHTLADFRGKPVLLNLWATWCVPCVTEMPTLDKLAGMLRGKVQVIPLSQDLKGAEKVKPYWEKAGFKALQPWLDTDAAFSIGMQVNLPTTILYDSQGKEVWRMLGGMDWTGQTAQELVAEAH